MRRNDIILVCFDKFWSYCHYFKFFLQEYISFRGNINHVQKGKKDRNILKNADDCIQFFSQMKAWTQSVPLTSFNILKYEVSVTLIILENESENRAFSC